MQETIQTEMAEARVARRKEMDEWASGDLLRANPNRPRPTDDDEDDEDNPNRTDDDDQDVEGAALDGNPDIEITRVTRRDEDDTEGQDDVATLAAAVRSTALEASR